MPQAYRYIRYFKSRRSLLAWKLFGERLDGFRNEDFACETVPGDVKSLVYKGKPFTVDYHQLTPMMLNELQKAHQDIGALKSEVASLRHAQQQQLMVLAAFVVLYFVFR